MESQEIQLSNAVSSTGDQVLVEPEQLSNGDLSITSKSRSNLIYISGDDVVRMQIIQAEEHQRQVDEGTLWKSWPAYQVELPTSTIYPHFIHAQTNTEPSDHSENSFSFASPDLLWTGEQKSTFIELIGRKSEASLPEIAQKIGKPIFECQHYLNQLRGHPRLIDTAEIPAAEEVVDVGEEPDISIDGPEAAGPAIERKNSILISKTLYRKYGIRLKQNLRCKMEHLLREKLRVWISELIRQMMLGKVKETDPSVYAENVVECESELRFPDWLKEKEGEDTAASLVNWDQIYDHNQSRLEFEEEMWLEEMDQYNSAMALIARGVPCKVKRMPAERTEELQYYMRAR